MVYKIVAWCTFRDNPDFFLQYTCESTESIFVWVTALALLLYDWSELWNTSFSAFYDHIVRYPNITYPDRWPWQQSYIKI